MSMHALFPNSNFGAVGGMSTNNRGQLTGKRRGFGEDRAKIGSGNVACGQGGGGGGGKDGGNA
jgi:hypothetical protein